MRQDPLEVQEQVKRLEGRLARQSRALAFTWLALAGVLVAGFTVPPKTVEATKFVLRGEDGKVRATLAPTAQGSALTLSDARGRPSAVLQAIAIGPVLSFTSDTGKECARLQVAKGQPALSLYDESNAKRRVGLTVLPDRCGLQVTGAQEQERVVLQDTKTGPVLRFQGKSVLPSK